MKKELKILDINEYVGHQVYLWTRETGKERGRKGARQAGRTDYDYGTQNSQNPPRQYVFFRSCDYDCNPS